MLTEVLVALHLLTFVRFKKSRLPDPARWARAGVVFPIIGLLIGGAAWALQRGLAPFVTPVVASLVVVAALLLLSRGTSLAGLAASADMLLAGRAVHPVPPCKARTVGLAGIVSAAAALALKVGALSLLQTGPRGVALLLAPMLGRWASVVMAYSSRPTRTTGLASAFVANTQFREFGVSSIITLGVLFESLGGVGVLALLPVAGVIIGWILHCNRRLGGADGATLAALSELVETGALCLFAALAGR